MSRKARKQKVNKYEDKISIQSELDFHGRGVLTENEIVEILNEFLLDSKSNGRSRLLVITGKGIHSEGGVSKIKPIVLRELQKNNFVKEFNLARRDRGGSGAIEVILV